MTAKFTELLEEVYTITNRPDLTAETKLAVRAATLKAHQSDYYSKDLFETGVEFPKALYTQSLDLPSLISNFRTLSYIRRMEVTGSDINSNDPASPDKEGFFDIITPLEVLDSYGINRTDVAYVAGRMLELRSSVEFNSMMMGCYVVPIVVEARYSSWIAELYPDVITTEAARVLFKSIGQDEMSATYRQLVVEQYQLLQISALTDAGY